MYQNIHKAQSADEKVAAQFLEAIRLIVRSEIDDALERRADQVKKSAPTPLIEDSWA